MECLNEAASTRPRARCALIRQAVEQKRAVDLIGSNSSPQLPHRRSSPSLSVTGRSLSVTDGVTGGLSVTGLASLSVTDGLSVTGLALRVTAGKRPSVQGVLLQCECRHSRQTGGFMAVTGGVSVRNSIRNPLISLGFLYLVADLLRSRLMLYYSRRLRYSSHLIEER